MTRSVASHVPWPRRTAAQTETLPTQENVHDPDEVLLQRGSFDLEAAVITSKARPWCRGVAWMQRRGANAVSVLAALVIIVACGVILLSRFMLRTTKGNTATLRSLHRQSLGATTLPNPSTIVPNDLWAIHDLLLVGFSGVFMQADSAGQTEVQRAALELVSLLPKLHPHAPCRKEIATALKASSAGKPALLAAAQASWTCLPASFGASSFEGAFLPDAMANESKQFEARDPLVMNPGVLGVCSKSAWPRTCSYWASLHTMAYRADALGLANRFLPAVTAVLAGGATMCGGCTLHFRELHGPVLSVALRNDFGETFWANPQCGAAHSHYDQLKECIDGHAALDSRTEHDVPSASCAHETALGREVVSVRQYHQFITESWEILGKTSSDSASNSLYASASAVFVVLHNLVTASIGDEFQSARRHNFYCLKDVLASLPRDMIEGLKVISLPLTELGLPGLDPNNEIVTCR